MSSSPPRCGPEEGGKSKWMVRSVPGKPVVLVGPKSQFESQLWQQLTHHKCRLQYYLLLGQVLVMSDGKCKSNFVSHGIVTCGCHSGTDMKIGGRQFQRWIRAIFCLKYIPAIFRPFLFPPKEHVIDFNLDSLISSVSVAEVRGPFHSSQSGLGVLAGRLD